MAAAADEDRGVVPRRCAEAEPHLPRSRCRSARVAVVLHRAECRGVAGGGGGTRSLAGLGGSVAMARVCLCNRPGALRPARLAAERNGCARPRRSGSGAVLSGVEGYVAAALARVADLGAHDKKARVSDRRRQLAFARMLGSAVTSQALLSAASFAVGLLLIRHVSDLQYGYFILASGAVLLMTALQNSFVNPPLVNRITPLDGPARGDLVGGLY